MLLFQEKNPSMKQYVQHLVSENSHEVWNVIGGDNNKKGIIFVCGDVKYMARDLEDVIIQIIETCGNRNRDLSRQYFSSLRENHRYIEDVWG